ncbi:Smr/MutS family endonuclease [Moraxella bovis]|uniref:Smr/MutS family endonuclease n=2 Tax=Moraxella bovis TaxID=476 RepID=A0AAQ2QB13_MORBO|nr:Smr/MutS family protein [Moraxella bovis]AWY20193.1 DNA mismatch repair protein MutS [Moraxella bovis]UYZ77000.1 Smr/MutS family endonuclease [Moraxella bovis]UYZ79657.1 Smr/MutS family endonuclease [Moraxella bovis]UYZ82473.1 Smr/MutS family endonuclease [Moraxella bovis]UYZ88143.1 Smr/MutS family endonuclease [Moraxella bovis]
MIMTTFKDLLSKDAQTQLKEMGGKSSTKSETDSNGKPTTANVMGKKEVAQHVKRFGSELIDDDKVLFMQAMSGVRPLKHEKSVNHAKKTDPKDPTALFRRANAEGTDELTQASLSDMQALLNPVAGEAFLSYKHPTLQNKVFEQLRQGKLRWYDAVDLHGSSIDEARDAVQTIITNAVKHGETVVKIVHGKGTDAIIKTCVNGWLRQISDVMAFVSAPANDGGNGAVLVLIKKKKLG